MARTNSISYYRDKLKLYLAQLNSVDAIGISDQSHRHKALDYQIDLLKKLKPLLSSVASKVEKRDSEGMFPELKSYIRHVDYLKKYVDTYTFEKIDFINTQMPEEQQVNTALAKQIEAKKQVEIIQIIENFDKFIEELIEDANPKTKNIDVFDGASLADLRII
jgi:hypothetical protein